MPERSLSRSQSYNSRYFELKWCEFYLDTSLHYTNLLLCGKDLSLSVLRPLHFLSLEVSIVNPLGNLHITDVQLCLCRYSIDGVNSPQRATIQMVWA